MSNPFQPLHRANLRAVATLPPFDQTFMDSLPPPQLETLCTAALRPEVAISPYRTPPHPSCCNHNLYQLRHEEKIEGATPPAVQSTSSRHVFASTFCVGTDSSKIEPNQDPNTKTHQQKNTEQTNKSTKKREIKTFEIKTH